MGPKSDPRRPVDDSRGLLKKGQKIDPKSEPKGRQNGSHMGAKMLPNRLWEGSRFRGYPHVAPKGGPGAKIEPKWNQNGIKME